MASLDKVEFDRINAQLNFHYGIDTVTAKPMFRLVWAMDEYEVQHRTWRDFSGDLFIREVTEPRQVRKYPEDDGKYILEHLVVIPFINQSQLPGQKMSYEPVWTFEGRHGEPLTPVYNACAFIVDTLLAAMGRGGLKKYVIPTEEDRQKRIKDLEYELFGQPEKDPLSNGVTVS